MSPSRPRLRPRIPALTGLAAALVLGWLALSAGHPSPPAARGSAAVPAPPARPAPVPVRGVALGLYYPEDRASIPASLDALAALGATHVSLPVPLEQQSVRSLALLPRGEHAVADS